MAQEAATAVVPTPPDAHSQKRIVIPRMKIDIMQQRGLYA